MPGCHRVLRARCWRQEHNVAQRPVISSRHWTNELNQVCNSASIKPSPLFFLLIVVTSSPFPPHSFIHQNPREEKRRASRARPDCLGDSFLDLRAERPLKCHTVQVQSSHSVFVWRRRPRALASTGMLRLSRIVVFGDCFCGPSVFERTWPGKEDPFLRQTSGRTHSPPGLAAPQQTQIPARCETPSVHGITSREREKEKEKRKNSGISRVTCIVRSFPRVTRPRARRGEACSSGDGSA